MKIELYINSDEFATKGGTGLYMRYFRGQETSHDDLLRLKQTFVETPEEIVTLRNMLEKIASQYNLDMIVYDRTRIRDTIRAFFKGIRRTPTVRIGKHKFTGNITEEQILKAIKS
jgi:hypothetical protein